MMKFAERMIFEIVKYADLTSNFKQTWNFSLDEEDFIKKITATVKRLYSDISMNKNDLKKAVFEGSDKNIELIINHDGSWILQSTKIKV
jgi:hypothetical protein